MAGLFDWSSTAASNTLLDGIDIDTNMSVANVDNAFRSLMAKIRASFTSTLESFLAGSAGLGVANGGTGVQTLTGLVKGNGTSAFTAITLDGNTKTFLNANGAFAAIPREFILKVTDDATALATGTGKAYFDLPFAFTLTDIRASLATAQSSGSVVTVDVNKNGTSVISTKLTIDNSETSTRTAATPAVISTSSFADGDRITVDIDQIGDGTAKGLVVYLIGTQA